MKTKLYLTAILILIFTPAIFCQAVNYDDVAVIVNQQSPVSQQIASYFREKRDIPEKNMIYISCPDEESIDSIGFEEIRKQIEDQILQKGLAGSVNYLVTTKGIPFNVAKSGCEGVNGVRYCSSFDSELSLILSPWSDQILFSSTVINPYYGKSSHFSRADYSIFLVTRLDAYSFDDVKKLIDHSGPDITVDKTYAKFIIDFSYLSQTDSLITKMFSDFVQPAIQVLNSKGWKVDFDPEPAMVLNEDHVFGYYSINYQPSNKVLNYKWLDGSISEIFLSSGNLTFNKEMNYLNELSIPDLTAEGATSSIGYVNAPYFATVDQINDFYQRYLDENVHPAYNLAESYFMAMPVLSNQEIIIGDPKTSLHIEQSSGIAETKIMNGFNVYPNPVTDKLNTLFYLGKSSLIKISIQNLSGQTLKSVEFTGEKGIILKALDVSVLSPGMYFETILVDGERLASEKFIRAD